jgi:hypothetical protein
MARIAARLPSNPFLWSGLASTVASLGLKLAGRKRAASFLGQWATTVLILGLYNEIVKLAGRDRYAPDVH